MSATKIESPEDVEQEYRVCDACGGTALDRSWVKPPPPEPPPLLACGHGPCPTCDSRHADALARHAAKTMQICEACAGWGFQPRPHDDELALVEQYWRRPPPPDPIFRDDEYRAWQRRWAPGAKAVADIHRRLAIARGGR